MVTTLILLFYFSESLRPLFNEVYSKLRKHSLNNFWYDALEKPDWLDLANEKNFIDKPKAAVAITPISKTPKKPTEKVGESSKINTTDAETNSNINTDTEIVQVDQSVETSKNKCSETVTILDESESDCELFASETEVSEALNESFKLKLEPKDKDLFCTGLTLGTQDYVGQRILQIAQILRNLSFTEENMPILAKNRTFFRFMLLCVGSRWNSIHQLGLDMLSNISSEIKLKEENSRLSECVVTFVTNGLHNQDRSIVIACLEILNKLSQNEKNEDHMLKVLDQKTYSQVCSFLTLHDVMLLIYTLECLYSLSSLGEKACNYIVQVHGIIDTLVSLVTVEGKSYGPKACIGMKLVETVSGVTNVTVQPQMATISQPQPTVQSPKSQTTTIQNLQNIQAPIVRNVVTTPQKMLSSPVVVQTTSGGQALSAQNIAQQHAHQQAIHENEQFALTYLRATYEPCTSGRIEQQELYKQYLNACGKIGRRGVIAPLHFPRCVR